MRILFLAHRLPFPPNKGDKIRSFWELRTLAKNHDVDLFCFYDDPKDRVHIDELRHYCRSHYVEPISALGGRIRAVASLLTNEPFSTAFYRSRTMAARISAAVTSQSYDLIFVFSSSMAQYAERWLTTPRILDLVDVDSDKWVQYASRSSGPRSWLWRREGHRLGKYEAGLVRSSCTTLVCTRAEAKLLRSKAPQGDIRVLENWLDTKYYQPETVPLPGEIKALQPYVVFSGSMDYFPNIDAVLFFCREVFPRLRSEIPEIRFVIAGRNPSAEVVGLSSERAVHVTGAVADMRPYLSGAVAAVAPMRIARGVQTKILEALAMGIPVAASSIAASALPSELASLLLVADDPRCLVARLVDCVRDSPEQRNARYNSVVRYVESLNLPAELEDVVRVAVAKARIRLPSGGAHVPGQQADGLREGMELRLGA